MIELETLLGTREKGGQKASSVFEMTANCAQWSTTKDDSGLLLMYDRGNRTGYPAEARGNTRAFVGTPDPRINLVTIERGKKRRA